MNSQGLRAIPLRQFAQQPVKTFPGGYVCLVRDVAYGNRYMLLRLRDPKRLQQRLYEHGNFATELAYAWQAARVDEAEKTLRKKLVPGSEQGEWFDLDIGQLAQLSKLAIRSRQPQPAPNPRKPVAAQTQGARSNYMRPFATAFILLLILTLLVMPRFEGMGSFPKGISTGRTTASRSASSNRYLGIPLPRIDWTGDKLRVQWNKVPGATSYEYRIQKKGGPVQLFRPTMSLIVTREGLSRGDSVLVEVRSRRGNFRSHSSSSTFRIPQINFKLSAPKLTVMWTGRYVVASWRRVESATRYEYRYSVNLKPFSAFQSTRSLRVSLTDIAAGDHVRVNVRAYNGESWSETARASIHIPS